MTPKHLYLLRHAEASGSQSRQDDKARELTPGGMRDALLMGAWLREQGIVFDLVATSSAARAAQTAALVLEGMKGDPPRLLEEDVLYEASARQLMEYVNNLEEDYASVLLVAHNPAISHLAEYLTKAEIGNMAPGSIVIIRFEGNPWQMVSENTGKLVRHVGPESLRSEG